MGTRYRFTWSVLFLLLAQHSSAAEPIVVAQGSAERSPKQPQLAVAANGHVHLVYGVGDAVFYSRSDDAAGSFSTPQLAFRVPNLSLGMRRGPRIASTGKSIVVTAIGGRQGKGRDGDLQAWHSTDDGTTWTGPVKVNDVDDSAREGLHGMAAGTDGSVWCVWLDLREKRTEVYVAKSTDGGVTWGTNIRVYRSPEKNVCECCHPSIVANGKTVHVMFRNSLAGNRDMYVAASSDGGAKFAPARKVGQGTWKLDACPMDGGMLTLGGKGEVITVWRRQGEIFSVGGEKGQEQRLGRGEQPWVTASPNGPAIIWTDGREGDLWFTSGNSKQPQKLGAGARDPMIATAPNGKGPVLACWESKQNGQSIVLAMRIPVDIK